MAEADAPRFLTYNIHGFVGRDRRFYPERIAEVLHEIDADVIAMQEVGARHPHPFDGYKFFEEATAYECVAGPTRYTPGGPFGNLLLSRWPVVHHHVIDITAARHFARTAIVADLESPKGGTVRVIAAHLGLRGWERQRQLMMLNHVIRSGPPGPLFFMGDLNFWRGAHRLPLLDQVEVRTIRHPKTFPSQMPVWSLDQIRSRPRDLLRRLTVVDSPVTRLASDHLPLLAEVNPRFLKGHEVVD